MIKKFLVTIALVAVGLLGSLGVSAMAQTARPMPAPTAMMNPIDQAFFMAASEAAAGNIAVSQMGLQRSTNAQVKQFAQAELDEQRQVQSDLTRTGQMRMPMTIAPKYRAAMAQLAKLSGEQFDRAFMDEAGVNAHLENAATFQREAAFGRNPALIGIANKGLPIIRQHFTTASSFTNYQFAQVARRYPDMPASGAAVPTPASPVVAR